MYYLKILMTFMCDVKIDIKMCEPHCVNLLIVLDDSQTTVDCPWMVCGWPTVAKYDYCFFMNLFHSPDILTFDIFLTIWHLSDILTSFFWKNKN